MSRRRAAIAFTFDDRGRMWVAECLSYPKWSKDGTGHDRIVILEDTDGDGKHDKKTVFAENLSNLSSLEYGFGGVFICSLPRFMFIPDRDRDDVPDGPPETLLDGWTRTAATTCSTAWRGVPTAGSTASTVSCRGRSSARRVRRRSNASIWTAACGAIIRRVVSSSRMRAGRRTRGDRLGRVRRDVHHQLRDQASVHRDAGGHYQRMFGADPNPHTYGLMESCADHIHWGGGHWTDSRGAIGAHSDAGAPTGHSRHHRRTTSCPNRRACWGSG